MTTATQIVIADTLTDVINHRYDEHKRGIIVGMLQALGHMALAQEWTEAVYSVQTYTDSCRREEESGAYSTSIAGTELATASPATTQRRQDAINRLDAVESRIRAIVA